jgi:hypothetical protein
MESVELTDPLRLADGAHWSSWIAGFFAWTWIDGPCWKLSHQILRLFISWRYGPGPKIVAQAGGHFFTVSGDFINMHSQALCIKGVLCLLFSLAALLQVVYHPMLAVRPDAKEFFMRVFSWRYMLVAGILAVATMIDFGQTAKTLLSSDPMGFALQLLGFFCTWLSLRPTVICYLCNAQLIG